MTIPLQAVIFDLGGTLVDWPNWEADAARRWALAYDYAQAAEPDMPWPASRTFVAALQAAETTHWTRVTAEQWSGPPTGLIRDGFQRLGLPLQPQALRATLDGYARAVDGWAVVYPDAPKTMQQLRAAGLRLGLLSNTWWAAAWHDADLATHGLSSLLDAILYTSDLPHSKPHPAVFREAARRLSVDPAACLMVGDRMVDDVAGALDVGMRAVWKRHAKPWPRPAHVTPTATIDELAELVALIQQWSR